jgi:LacI family transcriptional regulator
MSEAISRGHIKSLLLHSILNSSARLRIKGARKAMKDHDLKTNNLHVHHLSYFMDMTPGRLRRMIKNGTSLIYAMDDLLALQVINRLKDLRMRIPDDISLISHDDLDFADGLGITTVHQDLEKEGEEAVLAMHRLLKGELTNIRQLLPSRVILRKSLSSVSTR